eukprot:jgi/Botrbrau1/21237/Bobra.39_2s0035.1
MSPKTCQGIAAFRCGCRPSKTLCRGSKSASMAGCRPPVLLGRLDVQGERGNRRQWLMDSVLCHTLEPRAEYGGSHRKLAAVVPLQCP